MGKNNLNDILLVTFITVLAIGLFYLILQFQIAGYFKFILVVLEMLLVSQIFIRLYKIPSELGMMLLRSQKGIDLIDSITSKRESFFNFLADSGNGMAYGLLSLVFLKKKPSLQNVAFGLIVLAFSIFLVAPTGLSFLSMVLKLQAVEKSVAPIAGDNAIVGLLLIGGILLAGGIFLYILFGLVYYGIVVFSALVHTISVGSDAITKVAPGATFLLPGINLPLFEGILALAIVMIVHEGAHAILTRIAKTKLLSSGLVLFGIIPVGAFVEPDEAELAKASTDLQTRVFVAGPSSNIIWSCILFVLFFALNSVLISMGTLPAGLLGSAIRFIYVTLGLTFALNFVVGAVNLLPLPMFDGYRILELNIANKNLVKYLAYATAFFFILNFLPVFFKP